MLEKQVETLEERVASLNKMVDELEQKAISKKKEIELLDDELESESYPEVVPGESLDTVSHKVLVCTPTMADFNKLVHFVTVMNDYNELEIEELLPRR